ncbi:MAG: hypothetical protein MUO31_00990 [Thermodesulfovibrionales bacterium]|nr:hypothetical protein [Thermodesulfovibrionales bacterium]
MVINPLIIPAVKGAAGKAAAGAAAKVELTEKAAKATEGAFKSIEETTKMGGFQDLKGFSENIKNLRPVVDSFQVLGGLWQGITAEGKAELMVSLVNLFTSDAFGKVLGKFGDFVNSITTNAATIIDVLNKFMDYVDKLVEEGDSLILPGVGDVDMSGGMSEEIGVGLTDPWNPYVPPHGLQEF